MQSLFFYIWRMKAKWLISSLLISLTLLGFVYNQDTVEPNQELVLYLSDSESIEDIDATILEVSQVLENFGAENIRVERGEGSLTLTYFSDKDVESLKHLISQEELTFSNEQSTEDNESNSSASTHHFDIFEIQESFDFDANSDGFVLEPKSESDRYFNPSIGGVGQIQNDELLAIELTYTIGYINSIVQSSALYQIPDVRAGPFNS